MNKIEKILSSILIAVCCLFSTSCSFLFNSECKHEFDKGTVTLEPTCLNEGVLTKTCNLCNESITEKIPALGHDIKESVEVAANCAHEGKKILECKREGCDYFEEVTLNKTDHSYYYESLNSNEHLEKCHNCDYTVTKQHRFDNGVVITQATHSTTGVMKYICLDCNFYKNETIPKLAAHSWGGWYYKNENCHARVCGCGEENEQDHSWNNGVITKEPTHLEFGEKTYTCNVCSGTKVEQISKLTNHTYGDWKQNNRKNIGWPSAYIRNAIRNTD